MATDIHSGTDVSLTSLVGGIVNDTQELMKQQLALFQAEVKEDIRKTSEASTSLGLGLAISLIGSLLLCFMLVHLLAWAVPDSPLWVWFALVGGVVLGVGGAIAYAGWQKFRSFNPLPDKTAQALKENLEWKTTPR